MNAHRPLGIISETIALHTFCVTVAEVFPRRPTDTLRNVYPFRRKFLSRVVEGILGLIRGNNNFRASIKSILFNCLSIAAC